MAYAYYEKIARINLTTGEVKVEKLDVELAKKFIGGRGLGTKIVYDEGCADEFLGQIGIQLFNGDGAGGQVNAGNFFVVCVCHNDNLQKFLFRYQILQFPPIWIL